MENQKPELTSLEISRSYIYLPQQEFFQRCLSPMQFGAAVLFRLKTKGLGFEGVRMLGAAFTYGLTPVEIAVFGFLSFDAGASIRTIAKKRKLPPRLVKAAIEDLLAAGFLVLEGSALRTATLEDMNAEASNEAPVL